MAFDGSPPTDDDLYAAATGSSAPKASSVQPMDTTDLVARYLLGEAADQPDKGQQAAVAVAKNVAGGDISKVAGVIGKPGFSSAWSDPETRAKLLAIPKADPAYQRAFANARYILQGNYDPTGGATHFLNPDLYAQENPGKPLPAWAQGDGQRIGAHVFYGGTGDQNTSGYLGTAVQTTTVNHDPNVPSGPEMTDEEMEAQATRQGFTPLPPARPNPANAQSDHGLIYSGDLGALGSGARQGLIDVENNALLRPLMAAGEAPGAANRLLPGSGVGNALYALTAPAIGLGERLGLIPDVPAHAAIDNRLTQQYAADPRSRTILAQGGRFGGQLAATAPIMGVGGGALGAGAEALDASAPEAANLLRFANGAGGNSAATRLASSATNNAIMGAAQAGMTGQDPVAGAIGGAVLGPLAQKAGEVGAAALDSVANRLQAPQPGSATAALAQRAIDDFGIPLRAGQITENPAMRYLDSELVKAGPYAKSTGAQNQAFSRALASTIGEDADGITPEVMSNARSRIGKVFDDVAAKTAIPNRDDVLSSLGSVVHDASGVLPEGDLAPLNKQVESIASAFGDDGVLSGESYQALTRRGSSLDRAMQSSNPNIRYYAGELKGVLDDALEANAAPDDLAALRGARLQWKNLRTIQDLAAKASPEGEVSPALLLNAVRKSYKDMPYSGAGDIGDLAQIGQRFLKDMPDSGTAGRLNAQNLLKGALLPFGIGGATELFMHDPGAAAGAAAAAAGLGLAKRGSNALTAAALNNPLYRAALLRGAEPAPANPVLAQIAGQAQQFISPVSGAFQYLAPAIGGNVANRLLQQPAQ